MRAALVDCWWQGVSQDGEACVLSPRGRQWGDACLLPLGYGAHHVARTRCCRRQAKRQAAWEAVRTAWDQNALTQGCAPHMLADGQAWAWQRTQAWQRTSAAVEGPHGSWSPMHQNLRGLPRRRDKVGALLHTFACRALEGTTPASRFCRRTFPELCATVLSHIAALPQPRRRKHQVVLSH